MDINYILNTDMELLSEEEKKIRLYLNQKKLLDTFFKNGAISKAQYDKSFNELTDKMGMRDWAEK